MKFKTLGFHPKPHSLLEKSGVKTGYDFEDEIRLDAFCESDLLEDSIIDFYTRFGMLPSKVLADRA